MNLPIRQLAIATALALTLPAAAQSCPGDILADGVINAASTLGYQTVVSSRTGCPFLGRESSGMNDNPCRPWQKAALAYALSSQPDAVIIANRSAGYVHPEWGWRTAATDGGGAATSVKQAADLWEQGIEDVVGLAGQ